MGAIWHFLPTFFVLIALMGSGSGAPSANILRNKEKPAAAQTSFGLIDNLRNQIKIKEDELQKAEVVNKNFERMIQLVNILGQVDSFLTERTKTIIKKIAALAADEDQKNSDGAK